jgi:hypothetical protein
VLGKAEQQQDGFTAPGFGHVHPQARKIDKEVINTGECGKCTIRSPELDIHGPQGYYVYSALGWSRR